MLNTFAKLLLVATSLSPILGAVAVSKFSRGDPLTHWLLFVALAIILIALCWGLLYWSEQKLPVNCLIIKKFENNDKETLAFLLAYLLPFISGENLLFTGEWMTGVYILCLIVLTIMHAGAFHFNPVMGLLGYHFYAVTDSGDFSILLISREIIRKTGKEINVVQLSYNIYLHKGESNV
ncbi:hypothetical protein [Methanocalculus chunghsingensis]|nr:hypothetical protein [Methanocalculus chunghsingensis]